MMLTQGVLSYQYLRRANQLEQLCLSMNIRSVQTLVTRFDFKLDLLPFSECLEPIHRNGREVNENVFSPFLLYEAVAFRIIEPLHLSLHHGPPPGRKKSMGAYID